MPEEKVTAYTFAITGYPLPPFITPKRRRMAMTLRDELYRLDGMIGISMSGKVMLIHMETKNDAIKAQNRLLYCGFGVSEEIHRTLLDMQTNRVKYEDDEEGDK